MPVVMTTGYFLVALWSAFMFGMGAHGIATENKEISEQVTVYKIGVGYNGDTVYTCEDKGGTSVQLNAELR